MSASGAGSTLSLEIVPATRGRRTHSWAGSTGLGVCVCVCVCVCACVCARMRVHVGRGAEVWSAGKGVRFAGFSVSSPT